MNMNVDSVAGIAGADTVAAGDPVKATAAAASMVPGGFGDMVTSGLDTVNAQLMSTQMALQQLAVGDTQNLHQVMIRMEEARMSFQLLMQVRNRALESYQELMRMSV